MFCRRLSIFLVFIFSALSLLSDEGKTRKHLQTGMGSWYPSSKKSLNAMLDGYFAQAATKKLDGRIVGIVSPHAGFIYSGQCAAKGYKYLEEVPNLERIILLGVSHRGGFEGACVSDFAYNSTPLGTIPVDTKITTELAGEKYFMVDEDVMQYEHSLENQLPFIQKMMGDKKYKIVPVLFGALPKRGFEPVAEVIKRYVDERTLVIASSDFTHYGRRFGYVPFTKDVKNNLRKLDMGFVEHICRLDFENYWNYKRKTGITACGFVPVGVLINIFSDGNCKGALIDYYTSGDLTGDFSTSVSYASIVITRSAGPEAEPKKPQSPAKKEESKPSRKVEKNSPVALSLDEQKTLIRIARDALKRYIGEGIYPEVNENKYDITENLKRETGVFVTLKEHGRLRGCIGNLVGMGPLYLGVRDNVISAASRDPRFPAVRKEELNHIEVEISVMTSPLRIDDYRKIRLGTDGVIIKQGRAQAVYLPQVATETGWDLDEFLSHLCRKAMLDPSAYKNSRNMEFYIFQAQVFSEKELSK